MSAQNPQAWDAFFAQLVALRHQVEAVIATADALRGPDDTTPPDAPAAAPSEPAEAPAETPDVQRFFGRARQRREAAAHESLPHPGVADGTA